MLNDWTLVKADIKVGGVAFDIDTFDKLDDAYLYSTDGSQIYRDRVTGTIDVHAPGITSPLTLSIEQVEEMLRSADPGS